ncbi:putative KH and PIN-domain containing protein [Candidatus Tiddalikarchaeum anstoanum]|nr:putative KH and PIN-domain containing protein [Candidatus Tiddalikarchaeum anstoanum]
MSEKINPKEKVHNEIKKAETKAEILKKKIIESYEIVSEGVKAKVSVVVEPEQLSLSYHIDIPQIEPATEALLDDVRDELVKEITLSATEVLDIRSAVELKEKFYKKIYDLIKKRMPNEKEEHIVIMAGRLLNTSFGLGDIEFLLSDPNLEEIVINGATQPIWVFHKVHGWLKTNLEVDTESLIYNYASTIGRRVGRQINILNPLLDAHLITGDRVNSTLFPISSAGNTITIRKFRRNPWSIVELISNKTITSRMMAFLWLSVQYEMSILFSGGTGSGKTTLMNAVMSFLPANQRVISIEDTREINLPTYLHWVPLTTREANAEGKGEVNMLELLVNSLRMRPDYIIVGEIRRGPEADVLFEAIHTGHSVYSTLHADTALQTVRRLTNEPINISPIMLESLPLIVVMFRDRKKRIRRVLEISEVYSSITGGNQNESITVNDLWKWNPRDDTTQEIGESVRYYEDLKMHTGMSDEDIAKDMKEKEEVLNWMVGKKLFDVDELGKIINEYYLDKEGLLKKIRGKKI